MQMRALRLVPLLVLLVLAAPASPAFACSKDDTAYFDTFLDSTCLQTPLQNAALDPLGGIRLAANGSASPALWDTDTEFANGVSYQSKTFGPVGVSTLATSGAGQPAALTLPLTLLPLTSDPQNPILETTASTSPDSDNVDDPSVQKVASTYVMWYSGTAEDGSGPAIFEATSNDGQAWTRANGGNPVMTGGGVVEHLGSEDAVLVEVPARRPS